MSSQKITPEELWARQQISSRDIDYEMWERKRELIREFARMSESCIFMVDVFKGRYDFASANFSRVFGYSPAAIETIREQGDLLEERIHPADRAQLIEYQIEHGQFIYSLPPQQRNDYAQVFQIRILHAKQEYVNVISRQQVIETDRNGKAWIILGVMDLSPDQTPAVKVKRTVLNRKSGEIVASGYLPSEKRLTDREQEILLLIHRGLLSKEIAVKLNLSVHTVHNHRKNILAKLEVDNIIEALNLARASGMIL